METPLLDKYHGLPEGLARSRFWNRNEEGIKDEMFQVALARKKAEARDRVLNGK